MFTGSYQPAAGCARFAADTAAVRCGIPRFAKPRLELPPVTHGEVMPDNAALISVLSAALQNKFHRAEFTAPDR
jgi:hypothetical protein